MIRGYAIRKPRDNEIGLLPGIERMASTLYGERADELGLRREGRVEVTSLETFRNAQETGRLWVAENSGEIVGFALVLEIDGCAHLEELDVLPAHGRNGIGSALLSAVCTWAKTNGFPAVTLSTFRDVPWNGPFYQRRGFEVVADAAYSDGLRRLVETEETYGLRTDLRVIMRKEL